MCMDHLVTTWRKFVDTADERVEAHAVFHRPDPDCPCELLLTRDTEQVGAAFGVLVVTNSRLCEVYSKGPREGTTSYVCTLQGRKEPGLEVAFAHCYQTERPVLPGTTLTLRLRPLAPSRDLLLLHRLEWLKRPASCGPASSAKEAAGDQAGGVGEGSSSHDVDVIDPANSALAAAAAPAADECRGDRDSEMAKHEQQEAAAATLAVASRRPSLEPRRQPQGTGGGGDGGGDRGSQMDEIRSLLRTVAASQGAGAPGGNPRQALLAAVARSALAAPSGTTSLGGAVLQMPSLGFGGAAAAAAGLPPAVAAAAAGLPPAVAAAAAGPSRQGGGGGAGGASAGLPAFVAALMQATSPAGGPTARGGPRHALAPGTTAQQAGDAAGADSSRSSSSSTRSEALPVAAMQWLSGELAQLEQRVIGKLEAGLCQLEARLCSGITDTPGISGHLGLDAAARGAALPGGVAGPAAGGATSPWERARVRGLPAEEQGGAPACCLTSSTVAACSRSSSYGSRRDSSTAGTLAGVPGERLDGSLGGSPAGGQVTLQPALAGGLAGPGERVAAVELPPALEGRLKCLEARVAAVEDLCRQILQCVRHSGVGHGGLRS